MLGGQVQQIGVVFDLPRLPIVLNHQVAEAIEYFYMAVLFPMSVLIAAVVID